MATIQIRVDDELKAEADRLFNDIGLDTCTAIRVFLKQSLLHNGIPFELVRTPLNKKTLEVLADAENGRNMLGPFDSVDELMEALDAED